jgi:hypothetical protein
MPGTLKTGIRKTVTEFDYSVDIKIMPPISNPFMVYLTKLLLAQDYLTSKDIISE